MLVLFDIDATLLSTSRSGVLALEAAGRELHGPGFGVDGVEFAGRLDPLIIRDLLVRNGHEPTPARCAALRRGYRDHLPGWLARPGASRALPGVPALIDRLGSAPGVVIGLLTGNFEDTGLLKLRACAIDPARFRVRVWAEDSPFDPPAREHLPPVGLDRYRTLTDRAIEPRHAVIVGDTPHDARCAKAHGLRCLGVATGSYGAGALLDAGADHAATDLSDTDAILAWLVDAGA